MSSPAPSSPPAPVAVPDPSLPSEEEEGAFFDGQRPDFYIASQEKQVMISVHFFSAGRRKRILLPYGALGYAFFTDPDTIIIPIGAHELICKFLPPESPEARQLAAESEQREQHSIRARQGPPGGGPAPAENQGLPDVDAWEPPDDEADRVYVNEEEEGSADTPRSVVIQSQEPAVAVAPAPDPSPVAVVGEEEGDEAPNPLIAAALATPEAQPAIVQAESVTDAPPSAHGPEPVMAVPPVTEFPGQNVRKFMDLLQNWMIRGLFSVPDSGMTVRVMKKAAAPDQPDVEI